MLILFRKYYICKLYLLEHGEAKIGILSLSYTRNNRFTWIRMVSLRIPSIIVTCFKKSKNQTSFVESLPSYLP